MSAIPIRVTITVDPCGRYLVREVEKLLPHESYGLYGLEEAEGKIEPPKHWYNHKACVTHTIDLMVPAPLITTPQIAWVGEVTRP